MEQIVSLSSAKAGRRVWAAIAEWREAGDAANPGEWPLPQGIEGALEVESWRDSSAGREVSLG